MKKETKTDLAGLTLMFLILIGTIAVRYIIWMR